MKTMTCNQLGGACDAKFSAATFDEIAEMSKKHAMEMLQKGDEAHFEAIEKMKKLFIDPIAMKNWMNKKKLEFASLSNS